MGMDWGGLSQILLLLWDRGLYRELPRLCAGSAWPGAQTKAETGRGTTLPPGQGEAAPGQAPSRDRTPSRSNDLPLTLQQRPGNPIPRVPQKEITFSRRE